MNILVTGGAGNIGSAIVAGLIKRPEVNSVMIVDNLLTGAATKIIKHDKVSFIKSDANSLSEMSVIMVANRFDYVFHYAALVGVLRTLANPLMVLNDIQGIKNILELAKNTGVKRVFYSSSSEVYGEPVSLPQNELTTPLNSRLPYAIVKNVGESYCKSYSQEHDLSYTIFRFFNTYGTNQSEDFVIPRFLKKALNHEPIIIYGDGSQTRTFCYVDDNIDACITTLFDKKWENQTVNIGNDIEYTILELAQIIIKLTNSKSEIQFIEALKEGDMTRRQPDISLMKEILNRDLVPLETGLLKLINYYEG